MCGTTTTVKAPTTTTTTTTTTKASTTAAPTTMMAASTTASVATVSAGMTRIQFKFTENFQTVVDDQARFASSLQAHMRAKFADNSIVIRSLVSGSIVVVADVSSSQATATQQAVSGGLLGFTYTNQAGATTILREDKTSFQVLATGAATTVQPTVVGSTVTQTPNDNTVGSATATSSNSSTSGALIAGIILAVIAVIVVVIAVVVYRRSKTQGSMDLEAAADAKLMAHLTAPRQNRYGLTHRQEESETDTDAPIAVNPSNNQNTKRQSSKFILQLEPTEPTITPQQRAQYIKERAQASPTQAKMSRGNTRASIQLHLQEEARSGAYALDRRDSFI